ncbi:MAG TPA: DUF5916 domain-containing protein [Pyrinomonadaceae bacterium]|nr:DUF5916 domain-containing protein [Pyrinomonadaceae bacterium]
MKKAFLFLITLTLSSVAAFGQPSAAPSATPSSSPKDEAPAKPAGGAKPALVLPPEKAQAVKMPKFDKPPVIDGKLDDEVWKQAKVLKDFYQVQPGDNIAPSKPTEVLLGYDSKFLYVAFHCYDEPDKVRANIPKRDNIFDDDYVGILFDTFNDHRKAYEFDFNPLGVQADGIWTDGQNEDFNPDIVMESKGMLTSDGWTVEAAIPFKSLRYVAGKDKLWGAHFWRRIKRFNNELDMWMPLNRDISSWLAQEGHLSGLEGISAERTLELIPSLTLSETGKRHATLSSAQLAAGMLDPGRMVNDPIKFDPGLTGKYTITPNVTLDFAINPDFAQVESDQLVVTANQRFPIFFAEKRPFFLEGIDIFQTQIAAVHTRAIIDPDFAVKLTGKVDRNTFGLLLASDNGPGNFSAEERLTANPRLIGKNASVGILRLKRDIGKKDSFIGLLATYDRFVDRYNELGGFDTRLRVNKQTTFTAQVLATHTRRQFFFPDEGGTFDRKKNGFIYALDYNKDGRHFGYDLSAVGRTLYYRADVGFNRRANTNNLNGFFRYNSEPKPKARLISWRVYDNISTNFDWQGRSQVFNNESQIQFSFRRQTYLGVGYDQGYERVFEREFGPTRKAAASNCALTNTCTFWGADDERSAYNKGLYMFAGSTPMKKVDFNMFINGRAGSLDFDFGAGPRFPRVSIPAVAARNAQAAGLCGGPVPPPVCTAPQDPGPGAFLHFDATVNYRPSTPLNLSLSFTKERLRRYDTGLLAFDENIVSLRSTYQFTRFIFARGRIDFDSLASNVKGQFLFGWTPNPGTAMYIGYNDDLSRNGFNPFSGQLEPGFRRNGRTFFIKMSYLFRKSFG